MHAATRENIAGEGARDAERAAMALARGIATIAAPDHAFDGIRVLTRLDRGTSDAPLPAGSPHGQSSRDVPDATTPSIAARSWLTAWE